METVEREQITADVVDRPTQISWAALFAGLGFVIAMSWLLYLLGAAIGVSIADANDTMAIGEGLGVGAVVWILLSSLVVYFLGGALTARLSGKLDRTTGMLHGVTLWGVSTTVMLVLGYFGVSSLLQTGQTLVSETAQATASAATSLASGTASAAEGMTEGLTTLAQTELVQDVESTLQRRASRIIAEAEAADGAEVAPEDVQRAMNQLDLQTLQAVATRIVSGDMEQAKRALTENTDLSPQQIDELVQGISTEFQEQLGTANNNQGLAADVQQKLKSQLAASIAAVDPEGGAELTQAEVEQAMNQLDARTLQRAGRRLLRQDTKGAKELLTANTSLTKAEVDEVVDGVSEDIQQTVGSVENQVNDAVEALSSYTQAVLWTVFASGALGLAVAVGGGAVGAAASRRVVVRRKRVVEGAA